MRRSSLAIPAAAFLACVAGTGWNASQHKRSPSIIRIDPELGSILPRDARIERVASGFGFTEGPVWITGKQCLLFSDIPRNRVMKWSGAAGVTVYLEHSGYLGTRPDGEGSNGLAIDGEGRLILCEHGNRRVSRLELDGNKTTLADRYEGKRLNSPNDVVVRSNGDLYFTDPPFGLPLKEKDPGKELSFGGVFRLSKRQPLELLVSDLGYPNGIAFSPDEKAMYISVSNRAHAVVMKYELAPDGTLTSGEVFYDMTVEANRYAGLPDGMKIDDRGDLFATGPGGVYVISSSGKLLGRIDPGETAANCAWGDDGSTLYITESSSVVRIRTKTRGAGWK